ncbi:GNAT family N-acetyltransferase [Aeoliella mucimassa]|uniref:TDP-fucosamine acetyltransferase n=1 Tax=Aeoliella mucimassa TaxID=2527972 RepID=A0A518AS79_9BACT|nr:GNAT family N-acetyltransferase [Aeoliella mucimassa]QDU57577.1 TDP-fucosamine acetyltransferase [Aeoliella mucimassa]
MRTIQPLRKEDAPALLSLWNSVAEYDRLTLPLLNEKIWGDVDFDAQLSLAMFEGEQLAGFATAVCRQTPQQTTGIIKLLAVDADFQRDGVASELCQALEERCQAQGAIEMRVGESAPNYLTPGVDTRYKAAAELFHARQYVVKGQACNMQVDLAEWSHRNLPSQVQVNNTDSITYARATPADEPAIRDFLEQHWPSWWGEVSVALSNTPSTLHLAMDGDRVIGFAAHNANNRGTGWFGPMGTCPQYRGRGIGAKLLAICLDDMYQAGYPTATIPWVGPVEFYRQQCGAVVSREFVRFSKTLV